MTTQEMDLDIEVLDTESLMALFSRLEAPSVDEMHGDFAARMLKQPALMLTIAGTLALNNPISRWHSKGFRPIDAQSGRGYNSFHVIGRTLQLFPMSTRIAPSRFDGRPVYQLDYSTFRSTCGTMKMVDEVRRIDDHTYLGIGTWGFTKAARMVPQPFLLEGPDLNYLGDIGTPRSSEGKH